MSMIHGIDFTSDSPSTKAKGDGVRILFGLLTIVHEEAFWAKLCWLGVRMGIIEHGPIAGK